MVDPPYWLKLLVAASLCCWGAYAVLVILLRRVSKHWPTAQGTIISRPRMRPVQRAKYGRIVGRGGWTASVRYAYTVDGQEYEGGRVMFSTGFSADTRAVAASTCRAYATGDQVTVYYHPRHHWLSVLRPG
jgi:hypothetical protein